ncbi:hypothetical protein [Amycolatopsis jejuensis]|uniref:hypothetical protein n=1 Tax=Amycolatopsis jejuensis TaxID=330084 RepID=UPI0005268B0E|nr:hypothetical protein [Amycolatopsis jejuensis]
MSRILSMTCYADTHEYGWRHVDLFVHDPGGRELNWVHWPAEEVGPDGADVATARHEPGLHRTSPWRRGISADGSEYWTADAAWSE